MESESQMIEFDMQKIKEALESKGKYWIAFVGDSITSTEWVHPNWREIVEYVLKDKFNYDWGIKSFNFAYDGSTSRDLLERISEVGLIKPDLVVLMTGANDPFHKGIEPVEFKANIEKIKNIVKKVGAEFRLLTDNCPMNKWAEEKCQPYVEVLINTNIDFINLFEVSKTFPMERIYTFISEMDIPEERIKKGGVDFWHPNQLGNAYIAKIILKEVWSVEFDPEKYIDEVNRGEKLPRY